MLFIADRRKKCIMNRGMYVVENNKDVL